MRRWFRAIWRMISGVFGSAASNLEANEHVMSATFDESIEKREERARKIQKATGEISALHKKAVVKAKGLKDEIATIEKRMEAAKLSMQKLIDPQKALGKGPEEIKAAMAANPEFARHQGAFNDLAAQLGRKKKDLATAEADEQKYKQSVETLKNDTLAAQRAASQLKDEKADRMAAVQVAKHRKDAASIRTGLGEDTADQDLARLREASDRIVAEAEIAEELSDVNSSKQMQEYDQIADSSASTSQLDDLLDFGTEASTEKAPAQLPE